MAANDFVAYFEWHYVEDVKRNPDYEHTADLKATGMDRMDERGTSSTSDDPDRLKHVGMIKLWKIWDLRRKVRHVYAEGATQLLQEGKSYTTLPFAVLKFYELEDSFYPLPPIFNWLSPQDEVNESREMQKIHRRRAIRRYMREPQVKKEEFEKLETGEDMVCIEVPKVVPSPIMPIPDAPLENANWQQLAVTHEDFREITGASGESRGEPTADTATQANIINVRQQIRESFLRSLVADWLGQVARLMLLTMREKMQEPLQVRRSTDPFAVAAHPELAQQAMQGWEEIDTESIADLDVDISIDVASLSPVVEDQQRQSWDQVLMLLTNQQLLMLLMTPNPHAPEEPSPLLRKTLALHGIKSDQEVREIWRVGQQALQTMLLMAAAAVAAKGGSPGAAGVAPPGGGGVAPLAGSPAKPPSGLPAAGPAG